MHNQWLVTWLDLTWQGIEAEAGTSRSIVDYFDPSLMIICVCVPWRRRADQRTKINSVFSFSPRCGLLCESSIPYCYYSCASASCAKMARTSLVCASINYQVFKQVEGLIAAFPWGDEEYVSTTKCIFICLPRSWFTIWLTGPLSIRS
jgi:hypothetical protein